MSATSAGLATATALVERDHAETAGPAAAPAGAPAIDLAAWRPAPAGWYLAALAGTLPAMLLGMVASVLANRLAFAGWGLLVAVVHVLLLRAAWARSWSARARTALAAGWGAFAMALFAVLVDRHGEILDLGYRALLWPVYAAPLTRPVFWGALAGALAATAVLSSALRRGSKARRRP